VIEPNTEIYIAWQNTSFNLYRLDEVIKDDKLKQELSISSKFWISKSGYNDNQCPNGIPINLSTTINP
jgi:hypothetical protein